MRKSEHITASNCCNHFFLFTPLPPHLCTNSSLQPPNSVACVCVCTYSLHPHTHSFFLTLHSTHSTPPHQVSPHTFLLISMFFVDVVTSTCSHTYYCSPDYLFFFPIVPTCISNIKKIHNQTKSIARTTWWGQWRGVADSSHLPPPQSEPEVLQKLPTVPTPPLSAPAKGNKRREGGHICQQRKEGGWV